VPIALLAIVVSETLGLWLLNTHMVIPEARMAAARVAFHYAVFSTALVIVQVPYSALLVAHERFTAYAIFDIVNAVLRLLVATLLTVASGDLLQLFSAAMFGVTLLTMVAKVSYCVRAFPSGRYTPCADSSLLISVTGFVGWSMLGAASLVLNIQGVGILLNVFFGPVANAAQNIALQLSNATSTLASNLQITSSPQIIKAYASGERKRFHGLVEKSARLSFLLMLVLTAPIIVGGDIVLEIWLGTIPDHASAIMRFLLLISCGCRNGWRSGSRMKWWPTIAASRTT
jgi:O-antigen/teichoic acid export membrane protein